MKFKEAAGELYRRNNLLIDEARLVLAIVGNIKGSMDEFDTMNYKGEAEVLNDIGLAYQDEGDYSKALEYTQTALRTAQRYNEQWTEMWAYHSLGNIYLELGEADNEQALNFFQNALTLSRLIGCRLMEGVATANLGVSASRQGQYEEALRFHRRVWRSFAS